MRSPEDIRLAVEAVEHEVADLVELERSAVADGTALSGLRTSWDSLQSMLRSSPELPRCPHCGLPGPFDETHCRACWGELDLTWTTKAGRRADGGTQ